MIRNLKALGLALVALFAMSALAASAASAQQGTLTATESPFTLTGVEREGGENYLEAFGLKTKCPETVYTGHDSEGGTLENGDSLVTVTPDYKGCKSAATFPTTVDMNGCDYDLEILNTNTELGEDVYDLTTTVTCPDENSTPTVTLFTDAEHETEFCDLEITIEANKHYEGLHIKDETNGHLRLTGKVTGFTVHENTTPTHPSIFCTEKTGEGVLVLDVTIDADNEFGETLEDVSIHHA